MSKPPVMVTVYAPDGKAFRYTHRNARDLVNGAGWSWKPTAKTLPVESAPFARTRGDGPEPAQAVINNAGHNTDRQVVDVLPVVEVAEGEVVEDPAAFEPVVEVEGAETAAAADEDAAPEPVAGEGEEVEAPAADAAPARRSRRTK